MRAYDLYEYLKNAYETSTQNCNRYAKAIKSIAWDGTFQADGEYYFCKDRLTFTTESLDPFAISFIRPAVLTGDGSMLTF